MVSLFSTVVNVSQPTVVVTQWSGRGTKNVTYTTIANNMLDNDGIFSLIITIASFILIEQGELENLDKARERLIQFSNR